MEIAKLVALIALVALVALVACQPGGNLPAGRLERGAVARVGEASIPGELIAEVARRQGIPPREAIDALVADALAAEAARTRGLSSRPDVAWALTAARARIATEHTRADSLARGAPTDEEIGEVTDKRWRDYDVPERARVVHVVVLRKDVVDVSRLRSVAAALRAAVSSASDAATFRTAALGVDKLGLDVRVEDLPTFTLDGRIFEQEGNLDTAFTAAAFSLAVGAVSPPVDSPFGVHVILLLERLPAFAVPLAERRVALANDVLQKRARSAHLALLERAKKTLEITIDPAADAIMATVAPQ